MPLASSKSPPDTPPHTPRPRCGGLIFDPETLLLDVDNGIRQTLEQPSRRRGRAVPLAIAHGELRSRPMREVLRMLAGSDDPRAVTALAEQYWQLYSDQTRFQAPVRRGGAELREVLAVQQSLDLHYLSALGPGASMRMLQACGFTAAEVSIFTSPEPSCPCARPSLLENFICASSRAPQAWLLLSDNPTELKVARRLGVPALALAYDAGMRQHFDASLGMVGVAGSPADVLSWLGAHERMRGGLQLAADRATAQLRGSCAP